MICKNCGNQIGNTAKFCPECGTPVSAVPEKNGKSQESGKNERVKTTGSQKIMSEGEHVSPNIVLCKDGKYRWIYEMSLFRNPTVFIMVWKILFFVLLGIFVFVMIVDAVDTSDFFPYLFLENLKWMGIMLIGMTVLIAVGYLVYAAIMGGKYIVMFEMDDEGINHKQLPRQAKRADALAALTVLIGAAAGRPTVMGVGMNVRTEMKTDFAIVRKVRVRPHRNLIKLDGLLEHNQVYAEKEDFEFVRDYIMSHCVPKKDDPGEK